MTTEAAVERLNAILAHAWMVRTFLKHAEEIQGSTDMLEVPRTLFDAIRAAEPARERGDIPEFLRRIKGKVGKIRRAANYFRDHFREYSPHTNFEMACASLLGVVRELDEVFANVTIPPPPKPVADPIEELEIPDV
ncbi:MAG: hypothetical protein KF873_10690 [Gemmataceae bacterium]|nr:hypothetical protein [Planctomycetia bacterium]MBX3399200.1 hypothetical protein [Gemmataceae bacterium]